MFWAANRIKRMQQQIDELFIRVNCLNGMHQYALVEDGYNTYQKKCKHCRHYGDKFTKDKPQ